MAFTQADYLAARGHGLVGKLLRELDGCTNKEDRQNKYREVELLCQSLMQPHNKDQAIMAWAERYDLVLAFWANHYAERVHERLVNEIKAVAGPAMQAEPEKPTNKEEESDDNDDGTSSP